MQRCTHSNPVASPSAPRVVQSDAPTSRIFLESLAATCRSSLYSFSMIDLHTLTKAVSKINDRVSPPMPALSDLLAQLHEWMMY